MNLTTKQLWIILLFWCLSGGLDKVSPFLRSNFPSHNHIFQNYPKCKRTAGDILFGLQEVTTSHFNFYSKFCEIQQEGWKVWVWLLGGSILNCNIIISQIQVVKVTTTVLWTQFCCRLYGNLTLNHCISKN